MSSSKASPAETSTPHSDRQPQAESPGRHGLGQARTADAKAASRLPKGLPPDAGAAGMIGSPSLGASNRARMSTGIQAALGNTRLGRMVGVTHAPFKDGAVHVQRFTGTEHERLGDATRVQQIDLGGGVVLSWGQIVALAGDYYGTFEDLERDTTTPAGRQRIRAALEHYGSPQVGATTLPAPTPDRQTEMLTGYALLALQNIPHFLAGGSSRESWLQYHARAIDTAIRAGLSADNAQFTRAYAQEAFGQHFLTDSFSAGHIRTPRREIDEWYTSVFAPQVFNHFLDTLRDRLVEGIYAQVARQSRGARIFSGRARDTIRDGVNQRLDRAFAQAGGRAVIVQWFGRIVGGAVSGAIHDMEGARGVQVSSQAHPAAWRAVGDARLQAPTNPAESAGAVETEAQARQAVLAAKGDIDHAFSIGQRERTARSATPDPRALPQTVYFGFDHYDITARARPALLNAASYLIYHPDTSVELMGNTDPIGSPDYNTGLGMRRAEAVNAFLTTQGAESSRISTSSAGETILVTRDARQYWRNRRVELVWRSIAVTQSRDPAYERALNAVLVEIGPPYGAERFIPIPVDGANPPIPDWHWGSIPLDLKAEISRYVTAQVGPFTSSVLNRHELDEFSEDDNTIQPRPIARAIVNDLLRDPVLFLEGATGRSAGSP